MQMWVYIVRRILLIIPVLIGVTTITFVCFQALPIESQLIAYFGAPGVHNPCGYQPKCECAVLDPTQVNNENDTCRCTGSNTYVPPNYFCTNPTYKHYVDLLGLEHPVIVQWGTYILHSFTFQWGNVSNYSYVATQFPTFKGLPVATALSWLLPYTLELAMFSLAIILLVSIPLGNASAVNRNRPIDQFARIMSFSGFALPAFLLGSFVITAVTLILLPHTGFTVSTPWCRAGEALYTEFQYSWPHAKACYPNLPFGQDWPSWLHNGIHTTPTGWPTVDAVLNGAYWLAFDSIIRMILPALVIAYGTIAGLLRFVRNSMLEVMNLDYVRTARAKGVPEKIVTSRHAGRNSLNVTITVLGLTFAAFVGGFPVIESVFLLNGVGRILAYAVIPSPSLDYAIIFGSTLLFTFLVVAANIIVDVLYAYLDPRVRLG
ncbi:MAG TPA: ABC transporter permease [Thermoplasmata archaeon]|nr:ABC transporter permease [Thermoplasmata archaeon]